MKKILILALLIGMVSLSPVMAALETGSWTVSANGFIGSLIINSVDGKGTLSGALEMKNEQSHQIIGFWDEDSQKITFMRVIDINDPSKCQIFTGYRYIDGATRNPTLAGSFEGFQGTGATAQRVLYGWYAYKIEA
jgi:hypothetical protein